jgi:type I restriction enzyme S subunit
LDKVEFTAGQSPDSEFYNTDGEGTPFLQGNAEFGSTNPQASVYCTAPTRVCEPGDTLISVRAPVGELNKADRIYGLGRGVGALHPIDIDPNYLYYAMSRWKLPLHRAAQGSTFDAVTTRHFRQLNACLPVNRKEQELIVTLMLMADQVNSTAEAKLLAAQRVKIALMQQLFNRGLPGQHTEFKQTKIGEIPECWDIVPLGKIASIVSGVALNSDRDPQSDPHQYLTVIHVQRERIELKDVRYLELRPNEVPSLLIQEGDLLVVEGHANTSEIGRAAIASEDVAGMAFQNHIFRVRLLPECEMNGRYLLGVLNSERVRRRWNATCNTSSGLNTINRRGLRKLLIPKPLSNEQCEIAELLIAADTAIAACEQEVTAVKRMKQSLLQNLLTGKVRVKLE